MCLTNHDLYYKKKTFCEHFSMNQLTQMNRFAWERNDAWNRKQIHFAFGYFTLPAEKTDQLLTHDWKLQLVSRCMTHNMSMNFFKLKDVKTVVL